ncbi:MAG: type II toxin-antitoxin system RelE/ParE family toxin [Cytophagales bacterium]|nr:type II toxin-antitoxin system RelE/ParE family toxin [Cytophagales bacterium]
MALEVIWSLEAEWNLRNIINYLTEEWTEKEIRNFAVRLEKKLSILVENPRLCRKSERLKGTRECFLGKYNTLFYTHDNKNLNIITIWDNRQDPEKLKNIFIN